LISLRVDTEIAHSTIKMVISSEEGNFLRGPSYVIQLFYSLILVEC
jgi:hypothetical protein